MFLGSKFDKVPFRVATLVCWLARFLPCVLYKNGIDKPFFTKTICLKTVLFVMCWNYFSLWNFKNFNQLFCIHNNFKIEIGKTDFSGLIQYPYMESSVLSICSTHRCLTHNEGKKNCQLNPGMPAVRRCIPIPELFEDENVRSELMR